MNRGHVLARWASRFLFLMAVLCLAWYSADALRIRWYQREQETVLKRALETAASTRPSQLPADAVDLNPVAAWSRASSPAETPTISAYRREFAPAPHVDPGLVGRIEIPAAGVSAIVRTGDDAATLKTTVGHLPGTPRPGESGNVALAAHRDTFFRGLRNIRTGQDIRIVTPGGDYTYRVTRTFVVDPEDVWVLDATGTNTLTLVTCYPFNYIGSAPRRFIVRAAEIAAPRSAPVPAVAVALPSVAKTPHDIELPAPPVPVNATAQNSARPDAVRRKVRAARTAHTLEASLPSTHGENRQARKPSAFKRGMGKLFRPVKAIFGRRQKNPERSSPERRSR